MGYALWLVPSAEQRHALEQLMAFRPSTYHKKRSSRSYPRLDPHITLVTFVTDVCPPLYTILPKQNETEAVPVAFTELRKGDNYLGAMSITIAKSPELLDLHDRIERRLKKKHRIEPRSRRFPHMSLFYVDEDEERDRLERHLWRTKLVHKRAHGKGVVLVCQLGQGKYVELKGFSGEEVWLVDCNSSNVEEWQVMEKAKLAPEEEDAQPEQPEGGGSGTRDDGNPEFTTPPEPDQPTGDSAEHSKLPLPDQDGATETDKHPPPSESKLHDQDSRPEHHHEHTHPQHADAEQEQPEPERALRFRNQSSSSLSRSGSRKRAASQVSGVGAYGEAVLEDDVAPAPPQHAPHEKETLTVFTPLEPAQRSSGSGRPGSSAAAARTGTGTGNVPTTAMTTRSSSSREKEKERARKEKEKERVRKEKEKERAKKAKDASSSKTRSLVSRLRS